MADTLDGLAYAAGFAFAAAGGTDLKLYQLDRGMSVLALPTEELQRRNKGVRSDHDVARSLLEKTPQDRCSQLLEWIALGVQSRGGSAPEQTTYRIAKLTNRDLPEEQARVWSEVLDQYKSNNGLTE